VKELAVPSWFRTGSMRYGATCCTGIGNGDVDCVGVSTTSGTLSPSGVSNGTENTTTPGRADTIGARFCPTLTLRPSTRTGNDSAGSGVGETAAVGPKPRP